MTAGVYDITCEQGATFRRVFTWLDENEQPINLTGCSARMQVRPTHKSTTKWIDITSATSAMTLGGALGTITVVQSAAVTALLPVNRGVYDLEIVFASGEVERILEGAFQVTPEVTR